MVRILLTGGGTGGHVFPLVAVAQRIKKVAAEKGMDMELKYFGPENIYDAYFVQENITISRVLGAKLRRYFSLLNLIDFPKLIISVFQSLWKVFWWRPNVTFSKGGPGALPVLFACHLYKIPIIIHESDTIPGMTNRISGRWAKKVELGWQKAVSYFPNKEVEVVGIPLREEIAEKINFEQRKAKEFFKFNLNEPLILVVGGSQGAQRVNEFILANLEK